MPFNETNQQFNKSTPCLPVGRNQHSIGSWAFFLFWAVFFLLPMSCVEETERLTRAERKIVDSLVLKQTKVLRENSDSLCQLNFEASVTQVVDSILTERLKEIKKILSQ